MPLITSVGSLLAAGLCGLAWIGLGYFLLRIARVSIDDGFDKLLCSAALGLISYEAVLAIAEFLPHLRVVVAVLLFLASAFAIFEFKAISSTISQIVRVVLSGSSATERLLAVLVVLALSFEGIAAMAPLSGSDALRYHFTAPMLVLRNGFHPDLSMVHSFFTGQGHLLILTGLAFGSEKLALGLIFLGGVFSAAACAGLCRKWASREFAWLAALVFVLTPVVFWQSSAAGAPDIWMAFFATVAVLMTARFAADSRLVTAFLIGALAGALAGSKYTGCVLAASIWLALVVEHRTLRSQVCFLSGAFAAGIWPYLRNALWTGDPVFPFLLRWIAPDRVNSFTLASVVADTHTKTNLTLSRAFQFPLFAALDQTHLGLWEFFGPLCLALAPLIIFSIRNSRLWRAALIIWLVSALGIGTIGGGLRFLLPLWPIALAVTFGALGILPQDWRFLRTVTFASVFIFLTGGGLGLMMYGQAGARAAVGLTSREEYLSRKAPDYGRVEFTSERLNGRENEGKALVFMQHLYYLNVPFISGNPNENWTIDPNRFKSPQSWRDFFLSQHIRWVVRAPDYPPSVAAPLNYLEQRGELQPFAQGEVSDFFGMRIFDTRTSQKVVILSTKQ